MLTGWGARMFRRPEEQRRPAMELELIELSRLRGVVQEYMNGHCTCCGDQYGWAGPCDTCEEAADALFIALPRLPD